MELIEKMARAIMDHRSPMQPGLQWNIESDENRDWYRGLAQAALTALIEYACQDGVTDGDREAAAPYWEPGLHEDAPEAFARHRATAFAAGQAARDREIVEWLRGRDCFGPWQPGHFADAIERGEVPG